ncbi:MAG: hypothetical protein HYX47_23165 [Burkholderiales bacterium]|nr:hypothetical protein [Burkholderiales bacterium]
MRFSAAINTSQPMRDPAAAELVRRILAPQAPRDAIELPLPVPAYNHLPQDLDQRVRASGEW